MALDEGDIEKSRREEQSKSSPAKVAAAEKRRRQKMIAKILFEAKRLNDARAYAEGLRAGNVLENSTEWKRAWDYFYDRQS